MRQVCISAFGVDTWLGFASRWGVLLWSWKVLVAKCHGSKKGDPTGSVNRFFEGQKRDVFGDDVSFVERFLKMFEVFWKLKVILLMAEILHHLGCMKPYK